MSLERLHEHRRLWQSKPVLARVYAPWFEALLDGRPARRARPRGGGRTGLPGGGRARDRRPDLRWIASDLHPVPWNALAADAGRLPLARGQRRRRSWASTCCTTCRARRFLPRGGARPSRPEGRLALVEPWITPVLVGDLPLLPPGGVPPRRWIPGTPSPARGKDSFDGDAAVPWKIVRRDDDAARWRELGLSPPRRRPPERLRLSAEPGLPAGLAAARAGSPGRSWPSTGPPAALAPLTALRALAHLGEGVGGANSSPSRIGSTIPSARSSTLPPSPTRSVSGARLTLSARRNSRPGERSTGKLIGIVAQKPRRLLVHDHAHDLQALRAPLVGAVPLGDHLVAGRAAAQEEEQHRLRALREVDLRGLAVDPERLERGDHVALRGRHGRGARGRARPGPRPAAATSRQAARAPARVGGRAGSRSFVVPPPGQSGRHIGDSREMKTRPVAAS